MLIWFWQGLSLQCLDKTGVNITNKAHEILHKILISLEYVRAYQLLLEQRMVVYFPISTNDAYFLIHIGYMNLYV